MLEGFKLVPDPGTAPTHLIEVMPPSSPSVCVHCANRVPLATQYSSQQQQQQCLIVVCYQCSMELSSAAKTKNQKPEASHTCTSL